MNLYDIAIVGGGASGLAAAVTAQKLGLRVVLLERGARVGKKLLATGNGRCNLTNMNASPKDYFGDTSVMAGAMHAFPPARVMEFFESIGLMCVSTYGDRVFPLSDQAAAVLDALRFALSEFGGETLLGFEVKRVARIGGAFQAEAADGRTIRAKLLMLATGGPASPSVGGTDLGYPLFRQLGHSVTRVLPALTQLETPVEPIRALKGIRLDGGIALYSNGVRVASDDGDILFTEYGLSGTAVMAVSRAAALAAADGRRVEASLRFMPKSFEETLSLLETRRKTMPNRPLEDFLTGTVHKRLGQTVLKAAGALPLNRMSETLTDEERSIVAKLLTDFRLPVTGNRGLATAQASAGGAVSDAFDPETLESRLVSGLYACGEALDVDGPCGGYNLQWAWASGMFAAKNAALALKGSE